MTGKSLEHLIVREPKLVSELPSHQLGEQLPFPIFMCRDLVPEANVWVLYMYIKEITQEMIDAIDVIGKAAPHKHEFDEVYIMIGDQEAITFEVMLEEEFFEVATPACVFVPRGTAHAIRPVKATVGKTGGLIPVCMNADYTTIPV